MTISSQVRKAGPFAGNGTTTVFPFAFKVFTAADLYVVRTDTNLGADQLLVLSSDYTVSLNVDQNANPGGSITLTNGPLTTGFNITVTSSLEYLQATDLTNQGGFYPSVITNALDRLTIFCQQLYDAINRSLKISISTPEGVSTTLPPPSANKLIGWNENADGLQNVNTGTLATIVAFGTSNSDKFSGNGSTTQFALSANPGAVNNLDVSVGGITQRPDIDYTWASGTTLTFTTAPPSGTDNILVRYMQGLPQGYTTSGAVSFAPTGAGAVPSNVETELRERAVNAKRFGLSTTNSRAQNDLALYNAANSGARTIFIPNSYPNKYLLSAHLAITAAAQGIRLVGEDKQNTVLSWRIDAATSSKFALLVDAFFRLENVTLENTGTDVTNSGGLISYSPTDANGMHDSRIKNVRLLGWGAGIGATVDGSTLTTSRSQVFSNIFEDIEFNGCGRPIRLGVGANNNVWIRPGFWNNKGNRHIYINQGSTNLFIAPQFEPADASVTSGMLNAEFVLAPNNVLLNPYFEPCYGVVADSSPGTVIESPMLEGFDFTVGTLSSSAILRSTNVSNGGYFAAPMVSRVSNPVSRASVNPTSYCVSDDNSNTLTLCDALTSRDANFKLRPSGQGDGGFAISYRGSFTPTLVGTGGTAAHTYTQQNGWYVRVGNLVTVFFRVALSARDAGMTGTARIAGLPFAAISDALYSAASALSEYRVDLTAGYTDMAGGISAGSLYIDLIQNGDNVASLLLPAAGVLSATVVIGSCTYMCAA